MDWTYKHFHGERAFAEPRRRVLQVARAVAEETLMWATADGPGGFEATGRMAGRRALARFVIADGQGGGAIVRIELLAERSGNFGSPGYMLFEPFGYFDGQIRLWLQAIRDRLDGKPTLDIALERPHPLRDRLVGCVVIVALLGFAASFVALFAGAAIGLFSGELYLGGRSGGDGTTITGPWARVAAAAILLIPAIFVYLGWRQTRKRRRPKILGP